MREGGREGGREGEREREGGMKGVGEEEERRTRSKVVIL